MNMSAAKAPRGSEGRLVLAEPYASWSPREILEYFQRRQSVRYFAVADANEVKRAKIDAILAGSFEFNCERYTLKTGFDWTRNPSTDIEWLILLHKFYYAVGLGIAYDETGDQRYAERWVTLTQSWIDSVALDFLPSDVAGRRIQNWIFAHYYFVTGRKSATVTPEFYLDFLGSLQSQVNYLCDHLTPARNHRTLELYAVFMAAVVFPELQGADRWLDFAIDELCKNIATDFLSDGVHCELSTDYHHIVLRNFLGVRRLADMNGVNLPADLDAKIEKALEFSMHVHKPDGLIPSLSDGDTGNFLGLLRQGYEYYRRNDMRYVASKGLFGVAPLERAKAFDDSGYYVLRSGWGENGEAFEDARYLVFDCGPLGAGNHGHLDALSIELAAYGRSLVVDPGRYTYDESGDTNWRVLFRGTGYHNTVQVDRMNQTRYEFHKQKFKIRGPEPDHELKAFQHRPTLDYVHGLIRSHEYPVVHERKILFVHGEYWIVCDVLRAQSKHDYDLLFHLSPEAQGQIDIERLPQALRVKSPNLLVIQPADPRVDITVDEGFVSATYGVKSAAPVLRFSAHEAEMRFYTVLYPYKDRAPEVTVGTLPVSPGRAGNSSQPDGSCLTISIENNGERYTDTVFLCHNPGSACRFGLFQWSGSFFYIRQNQNWEIVDHLNDADAEIQY